MSAESVQKFNIKSTVYWIIALGIPALIMFVPITNTFTSEIRSYCAITILIILLMAFGKFNTMLLGIALPVLYTICHVTTLDVALSSWENSVAYIVIGALLFATVLQQTGVINRITFWCMQKAGGSFNRMLYIFLVLGSVISYFTFGNCSKLMPTIAFGFCLALGIEKKKEGIILMMVSGVCSITARLLAYYPVQMGPMVAAAQQIDPDFSIAMLDPLIYGWPIIPFMLVYLWILTKMYKTKDSDISGSADYFKTEYEKLGPWKKEEKKALVYAFVIVVYLFTQPLHGFSADYAFMVIPWLAFFPIVNLADSATIKNLLPKLDIIFFIVGCLSIGIVGSSLGVTDLLTDILTPIFSNLSSSEFLFGILGVGGAANMLLTPLTLVTSFCTPVVYIADMLGLGFMPVLLSLYYTVDFLFLPHEVPAYLYLFAFGVMSMKDFIKLHCIKNLLFLVFFGLVMIPWWHICGIL
ncbi:MAG: anion permease [Peptococcaceae bacterium]|nr:anion permease [Peptococcaceae bacterium]